jgi:PAS domain S-box-containing protein
MPPGLSGDRLFRALLRCGSDGVILTRLTDGVILEVSDTFCDITGYPRERLVGRSTSELGLVETSARRRLTDGLVDGESPSLRDGVLHRATGEVRQVEFSAEVLSDGDEAFVLTAMRDVTERRRAEQALRVTEARYRDLFENAATGIAHARAGGDILEVNRAWAAVLGYESPEQYLAEVHSAHDIYQDPAQRSRFLREVRRHGSVKGFEARLRHRDGSTVWVALDARAVTDDAGELVAVHASGLDITDRKRAEEAVRESEAQFRSIFVSSLDGIIVTSADGRILSANPAACEMLGRTEDQLRMLDPGVVVDLTDERLAALLGAPRTSGPPHADVRMRRADGSGFPAEITCSAFQDADGVTRTSMIIRDVSDRWQADAELRRAKQDAETANQAKSEFLSRMSHELRTPMNAVLGFAQLLGMDVTGEQQESVQQIRNAGRHLLNLINEVLDLSRIEAGELSLSTEPVLVEELIGEAVALMAPVAAAASVTIRTTREPGRRHHVLADRQRMRQVLLNLLSNGIKYNEPGGSVSIECHDDGVGALRIAVQDTGIGISAADQTRLFTPFERLSAAGSAIEGAGVGLALSLRLTQAMGGRIMVDSAAGRGSTFTVLLPEAVLGPPGSCGPTTVPVDGSSRAPARAPRATVLCVEDNPANVRLLEEIVRRRPGWELVHAAQGGLGVDLATARRPDLILLDLHLPDLPGTAVLQRLKSTSATSAIPVVIVSADASPGQVDRLRAAGAADYLTKPIDVSALLDLLDAIADRLA